MRLFLVRSTEAPGMEGYVPHADTLFAADGPGDAIALWLAYLADHDKPRGVLVYELPKATERGPVEWPAPTRFEVHNRNR